MCLSSSTIHHLWKSSNQVFIFISSQIIAKLVLSFEGFWYNLLVVCKLYIVTWSLLHDHWYMIIDTYIYKSYLEKRLWQKWSIWNYFKDWRWIRLTIFIIFTQIEVVFSKITNFSYFPSPKYNTHLSELIESWLYSFLYIIKMQPFIVNVRLYKWCTRSAVLKFTIYYLFFRHINWKWSWIFTVLSLIKVKRASRWSKNWHEWQKNMLAWIGPS